MGFFPTAKLGGAKALPTLPQCGRCGLLKGCQSPKMPPSGQGMRKILFIGEAPGKTEDEQGKPFVGPSGELIRRLCREAGCDMEDGMVTNAARCRPPDNAIEDIHIESCRPLVVQTVRAFKPSVIVLLGASAVKSVIGPEWEGDIGAAGRWVGWRIPSARWGAWLCPTYHPSYILRANEDPALVKVTADHLAAAFALEGKPVEAMDRDKLAGQVECITSPRIMAKRITALSQKRGVCAIDYETTGLKPERAEQRLYSASFCLDGADTFSGLLGEECWGPLRAVLLNRELRKVGSNIKFETRWSLVKLGVAVAGWAWDTMLGAHLEDQREGITSIKFQSYVRLGVPAYNSESFTDIAPYFEGVDERRCGKNALNRIHEAPAEDLLKYGGLDSLLEYHVAVRQAAEVGVAL